MPRDTPTRTGTSAPTPTGRWPIDIATTSSARSTPTGRWIRSSASNWPATSWPGPSAGRARRPKSIDQLVATHFLRNSQDGTGESDGNPDEVRADKYAVLEGTAQVIGSSLLGLTIQCAKCHDHKFEPVTQKEYYQLQAILYPAFNLEHWVKPNDARGDRRPARRALAGGRRTTRRSTWKSRRSSGRSPTVPKRSARRRRRPSSRSSRRLKAVGVRTPGGSPGSATCRATRPRSPCCCEAIPPRPARRSARESPPS